MAEKYALKVNGKVHEVTAEPDAQLLYILRNDLQLNGPKFGCGLAQCGACTCIVDGAATRTCVYPVSAAVGKEITTLEGLGNVEKPHPVQKAFIEQQAAQCGYCMNGMIMTSTAFLMQNRTPTAEQIKEALNNNLCRCACHVRVVAAVQQAAKEMS
ncbi:MAG: (2Fe-2S)-binding protein [Meiothermus sp.]|nr:(2Fe-2S)-binding protein [Meiothermus sp.]